MDEEGPRITLRIKIDELEMEVSADGISNLESAYLLLLNAKTKLGEIKRKYHALLIAEEAKGKANRYWIEIEDKRKLKDIDETPIAMMLSLLESYPESKKGSIISEETGIGHPTISKYFSGTYGEHSSYFEKDNSEWKLSSEGVLFIDRWLDENTV